MIFEKITGKEKDFLWKMLVEMCEKFVDQYNAEGRGFRRPIVVWKDAVFMDDKIYDFYKILKKIGVIPENNVFGL